MKPHLLSLSLIFSLAAAVQADDRHQGNSRPVARSAGQARVGQSFRYNSGRSFAMSPRIPMRSMPAQTFSQRRVFSTQNSPIVRRQFNAGNFNGVNHDAITRFQQNRQIRSDRFAQFQGARSNRFAQLGTGGRQRTVGNISPGHNHVFAQRSVNWHSDWDRHHDHWWNGHRCRFVNGSWFIFDIGFFPWFGWPFYDYYAYDNYPYGYPYYGSQYGYNYGNPYDSGYPYDSSYDPGPDNGSPYYSDQSDYDSSDAGRRAYDSPAAGPSDDSAEAQVVNIQARLQRQGYYHGQIDGIMGPDTRRAIGRFQRDKGMEPSGYLNSETLRALGLQHVAQE